MTRRAEEEPSASNHHSRQDSVNEIGRFLQEEYESTEAVIIFEVMLDKAGFLTQLEEAGILPLPKNLNPFDPEIEEDENNKWASDHPQETAKFIADLEKREETLKLLYIGSLLPLATKPRVSRNSH